MHVRSIQLSRHRQSRHHFKRRRKGVGHEVFRARPRFSVTAREAEAEADRLG
jgi:hypothetical protein